MKLPKIGLLPKLFAALAVGALVGLYAPDWAIRSTNCFRDTFGQFIKFFVPFIIIGLVTPAIAETGRYAGRALLLTMGLAYASTLFAGYFAYGVSRSVFPHIMSGELVNAAAKSFPAYFSIKIPPFMDVTSALVTSFLVGLGIVAVKGEVLERAARELREIVFSAALEEIRQYAFADCGKLWRVYLPGDTEVDDGAFAGCADAGSIPVRGDAVPPIAP